ncbi:MAG: hypothetical protein NTV30_07970 [Chloroflexi bacterium]|nr:hypothetical protein [Chloroflexota bacterium]
MKPGKPDKSVSQMDVLKDIRGLLSSTSDRNSSIEIQSEDKNVLSAKKTQLKEEIKSYKELVQKQQQEIDDLKNENKELAARLTRVNTEKNKPAPQTPGIEKLQNEIAMLEARISELSSALSQVDSLLQLRVKEILKRIATIYQEAGQGDVAIEFRREAGELENAENFARFLQVLLNQDF